MGSMVRRNPWTKASSRLAGRRDCSRWCTSRTWPRPWPSTRISAGVVRQGSRDGYWVLTGIGGGEIGLLTHPPSPAQNEGTVELNSRAVG